ncbi:MAG: amino acid permease [Synergistes sp.]|nr:amino acid permease [Synergistes sp.]
MSTETKASGVKSTATISVFTLAMMNVAAIVSLRGLPAEAEYGLASIFYYLFAAVFFLIPVSLAAAEMATALPQKGGVFRWVGEAFGARAGFVAIFLQWLQNTIWFPTVLTFAAVSIAYIGTNTASDTALAANKFYTLAIVLAFYWGSTLLNFRGMKLSGAISKWGTLIGTVIPAAILIVLGIAYYATGHTIYMPMQWDDMIPNLADPAKLSLAVSIFLFFAGMEASAVHVKEIENPEKNYPLGILISVLVTVVIFVFGTLALGFVIPQKDINLTQSLLVGYRNLFAAFGLEWLSPIIAICLALGVFSGVSTWIAGPSKGVLAVGKAGYLPPILQKVNKHGVQVNILYLQSALVTVLSIVFVLLPSVQAAYQILSALTVTMYLIMYMLMFGAFLKLRISEPELARPFKVPFGKVGMWFVGGVGLLGSFAAFIVGFIPPAQIVTGSNAEWVGILILGNIIAVGMPVLFYACRKESWKDKDPEDAFEPFNWQLNDKSGTKPAAGSESIAGTAAKKLTVQPTAAK